MDAVDKKSALDFLWYEVWMFNETFFQPNYVSVPLERCTIENNALLESFLIHARNLVYFLENSGRSSDIKCSTFGLGEINIELPPNNGIDEIDKYLAHLTKKRIKSKIYWNRKEIREKINEGISKFLNQLSLNSFPTKKGREKSDFEILLSK